MINYDRKEPTTKVEPPPPVDPIVTWINDHPKIVNISLVSGVALIVFIMAVIFAFSG